MSRMNDLIREKARPRQAQRQQAQDAENRIPDGTPGDGTGGNPEPEPTMSEVMSAAIHYAARRGRR
jgi:hypothetical protein